MLRINLVPERTKKEINLKKVHLMIKGISYVLIITTALIGTVFVYSKTFLLESSAPSRKDITASEVEDNGYNKKVRIINSRIKDISEILNEDRSHLRIIKDTVAKIPPGISLSNLEVDTEENILKMSGRADLRETLLELKERMNNDPLYSRVDFPLRNILKKENIDFSISADLDLKTPEEENEKNGQKTK